MNQGQLQQWDKAYNLYHVPETEFVADFIGQGSAVECTNGTGCHIADAHGAHTGRCLSARPPERGPDHDTSG